MADDNSNVVGSESKMITEFLINTCRLRQPDVAEIYAVGMCAILAATPPHERDEADLIPLITGSVAEFYIQPMLSCIGDIDIMCHRSNSTAIPQGYRPPTQLPAEFDSQVKLYEIIDSEYPDYVHMLRTYALAESTDDGEYRATAVYYDRGPPYVTHYRENSSITSTEWTTDTHGPAHTLRILGSSLLPNDTVTCVRCLVWPTQADDWPTRRRNYGWPDSATIDRVVSNGCDAVCVAHRLCRRDEWMSKCQWRLSFSRAEIILLNSWTKIQQIVYHMLRIFVKTERLADITGTKMLSNYHLKTLMLWACELKPKCWWTDDVNVVRISVELLHILAVLLKIKNCPHYFVNNCNLLDSTMQLEIIANRLLSITESWLSTWFVNNYLRICLKNCPKYVFLLLGDVGISTKLSVPAVVSAVVECRKNSTRDDVRKMCGNAEVAIVQAVSWFSLTQRSCVCWISELPKIDSCFSDYFTAVAFLHVANKIAKNSIDNEFIGIIATLLGQFTGKRRCCNQISSLCSLTEATKLIKVVANNSRSTVQLILIELSKAYLYRALRCKDSDSDSIYCLANVYLALLYYTTGQYQKAIDHCPVVTRSHDHSQCSFHVVQGELMPQIDDDIDSVLGLAVFYQYVRTAALNQQQQTQHVSVFSMELFAHYLHIRCQSVVKCRQLTQMSSADEVQRYIEYVHDRKQLFIADVLLMKSTGLRLSSELKPQIVQRQKLTTDSAELDTSDLVELLQRSALEHITAFRLQLEQRYFRSVRTIVTTDFEALYAYKRDDYQRCLRLSMLIVLRISRGSLFRGAELPLRNCSLIHCSGSEMMNVFPYPEFIQLLDDDIVSLIALTLIVNPYCRQLPSPNSMYSVSITQLTLSLYLVVQCQLKLHDSMTSLTQTLSYIETTQRQYPVDWTLDRLILKLAKRKIMIHLT